MAENILKKNREFAINGLEKIAVCKNFLLKTYKIVMVTLTNHNI